MRGDKKLLLARSVPTMSAHISIIIPLILTSMVAILPSTARHSLTCLPLSSSLKVRSEGELEVQCNVTVPEEQVRFSSMFSLDDCDDHDDHNDYDDRDDHDDHDDHNDHDEVPSEGELKVQCNVTVPEEQVRFSFMFSLDDHYDHDDHDDYDDHDDHDDYDDHDDHDDH